MSDKNFAELLDGNAEDSIDKTAEAIEKALGLNAAQRFVLHKLIRDEVRRRWRNVARETEPRHHRHRQHHFNAGHDDGDDNDDGGVVVNPAAGRTDYLSTRFALGDGRFVEWGKATIEEHRQRIALLTAFRDGTNNTISSHEEAIKEIENAGVTCLNDLVTA